MIAFPINLDGDCVGVVELWDKSDGSDFSDDDLDMVLLLGGQAKEVYRQAVMFRQRESNYSYLDTSINAGKGYHTFIAKNPTVLSLIQNIRESGNITSSVLITGESGVGKELFAEQVHLLSSRANKPFIRVSCASLAPSLLESELFGHVKGAYTDASSTVKGRFEIADGGTLFLDEIGELPWNLQSKLLRVIQEKNFERVGSSETISVDVRIVAATNRDLEKMIQEKLIKFATRIPVFMYLTDYREQSLKDVITQLEPGLFKKVTGLDVKDFELLVSLNVFNSALMNDAVYKFKRYEDSSLDYIGFDNSMKETSPVGGYDTVISREDYEEMYFKNEDR